MEMKHLHDWYVHMLQDLHSAETQVTQALPKMAEAASAAPLKKAFEQHLEQSREHLTRVNGILKTHGKSGEGKFCKGMEGLIKEGDEMLKDKGKIDADVMDAALIAAAQKVEHYEIASYGTARAYAELMGHKEDAKTLQKTLDEEGKTNKKLTKLAEGKINKEAKANGSRRTKSNGKGSKKSSKKAVGKGKRAVSKAKNATR